MADISKVTTPEGETYNYKDGQARDSIESLLERIKLLESMCYSGSFYAPTLDSDGNPILSADGKAIVSNWMI